MSNRPLRKDVLEGESGTIRFTLLDEDGEPVPLSAIMTLTLDLYDVTSQGTVNSRASQDVLNTNGVTVDADSGEVTWQYDAEDVPYIGADDDVKPQESEIVGNFRATCSLGSPARTVTIVKQVRLRVKNAQRFEL